MNLQALKDRVSKLERSNQGNRQIQISSDLSCTESNLLAFSVACFNDEFSNEREHFRNRIQPVKHKMLLLLEMLID